METEADQPSARLVEQRIRNRIIESLELAASFEVQQQYERDVPIAYVPGEVLNQWGGQFPTRAGAGPPSVRHLLDRGDGRSPPGRADARSCLERDA